MAFCEAGFILADLMGKPADEGKQQMLALGIPAHKIHVIEGPIVNPRFGDSFRTQQEAREELGIDPDKFTVLLMSGVLGFVARFCLRNKRWRHRFPASSDLLRKTPICKRRSNAWYSVDRFRAGSLVSRIKCPC